jgi:hypothetical protein
MYRRKVTHLLKQSLRDTPAVIINGARQTGKSTLVQSLIKKSSNFQYLTLDNANILTQAKLDPVGFIEGIDEKVPSPIIIDEIQRAPELLLSIKNCIDKNRKPGRFVLTGSVNLFLLPKLGDSLAGRTEIFTLWPLSQGEIEGVRANFIKNCFEGKIPKTFKAENREGLLERISKGGYPEGMTRKGTRQEAWFSSYIATILQRDVREIADVQGISKLPRLLSLLATRSATLVNMSDIATSTEIPYATLNRYIDLLKATFLIALIPAWSSNLGLRLIKSPKLLINDTGLLLSLLGVNRERLGKDSILFGSVLETFVGMELLKLISGEEEQFTLHHYRTLNRQEVDYVIERKNGEIIGIEVKSSSTISPSDLKGLKNLAEATKTKFAQGIVLYGGQEVIPLGDRVIAMPISGLWG